MQNRPLARGDGGKGREGEVGVGQGRNVILLDCNAGEE